MSHAMAKCYRGGMEPWPCPTCGDGPCKFPSLAQSSKDEPWLIWSNQHIAWWRPNSRGYTYDIRAAGSYSKEYAIRVSGQGRDGWGKPTDRPDELAIPLSALPEKMRALAFTEIEAPHPPQERKAGE